MPKRLSSNLSLSTEKSSSFFETMELNFCLKVNREILNLCVKISRQNYMNNYRRILHKY